MVSELEVTPLQRKRFGQIKGIRSRRPWRLLEPIWIRSLSSLGFQSILWLVLIQNHIHHCLILLHLAIVIMESLVKKKQKGAILELKRRHLKNTIFYTYTPYPAMKIQRISASSAQETRNDQFLIWRIHYNQYAVNMDDPNITMEEYIRLEEEKLVGVVRCITGRLLRMERSGMMKTFTTSDLLKLNSQL
ncbi:hypothetical protein Tco_0026954 [Tanacetum coccineum]